MASDWFYIPDRTTPSRPRKHRLAFEADELVTKEGEEEKEA
jgi:hypothetical protein